MDELGFTRERFLDPPSIEDDLIAEGILNRVLRVTEEAGHVSSRVGEECGCVRHAVVGARNRLAHAYGEVDREIVWTVIQNDFNDLLAGCRRYCEARGLELASWR